MIYARFAHFAAAVLRQQEKTLRLVRIGHVGSASKSEKGTPANLLTASIRQWYWMLHDLTLNRSHAEVARVPF